jgi:hypothetical protein
MEVLADSILKKGYIPLACDRYAAVAWQGEYLPDFWMWNGKFTEYEGGIKHIRTAKVGELKEAALHYWQDKWVPLRQVDEGFLRRMERALREHQGLKREGVKFPDGQFLKAQEEIPEEYLGPEVRQYLGLPEVKTEKLVPERKVSAALLVSCKQRKVGEDG